MKKHDSRQHAFTLVEMLVVISLITLLISMLLPALGASRESARRTKCAAMVRSLVDICVSISTDQTQALPDLHNDSGKWRSTKYLDSGPNPHTYDIKARDWFVKTFPVSRDDLYCPSNNEELWNRDDFWTHPPGDTRSVWGYVYYAAAPKGHATWVYADSGSSTIFANKMTDQPRYSIVWSDLNRQISPYGWYRFDVARAVNHFNLDRPTGTNAGFLDSHVEWITFDEMKPRMTRGSWSFWW